MNYQRQISLKVLVQEMGEAQQRKKFLFQTVLKMGGLQKDIIDNGYKIGIERGYSVYLKYMKKFFDLAHQHHIKVMFYEFPWPKLKDNKEFHSIISYYQNIQFKQYKEYSRKYRLNKRYRNYANVYWLKYNYFWPLEYFVDPLHLNDIGAKKLTRLMSKWYAKIQ